MFRCRCLQTFTHRRFLLRHVTASRNPSSNGEVSAEQLNFGPAQGDGVGDLFLPPDLTPISSASPLAHQKDYPSSTAIYDSFNSLANAGPAVGVSHSPEPPQFLPSSAEPNRAIDALGSGGEDFIPVANDADDLQIPGSDVISSLFGPRFDQHEEKGDGEPNYDSDTTDGSDDRDDQASRLGANLVGSALDYPPENRFVSSDGSLDGADVSIETACLTPVCRDSFSFLKFILTCSNGSGLSQDDTSTIFDLHKRAGALPEFENPHKLFLDIKRRHASVHLASGGFYKLEMDYSSAFPAATGNKKTGDTAEIRGVEDTVCYIMSELVRLGKVGTAYDQEAVKTQVVYEATAVLGTNFDSTDKTRLYGDAFSADAIIRLQHRARQADNADEDTIAMLGEICILAAYLFIDKHNTTKLNKRSLHAVVLFLKNIVNGRLRGELAFVIAYIPAPSSWTDTGDKIAPQTLSYIRRLAVHQTMSLIVAKLTGRIFTLACPDDVTRRFQITVVNLVLDSPELRVHAGSRGGTAYETGARCPCPRCWMSRFDPKCFTVPDRSAQVYPRTSRSLREVFSEVRSKETKKESEAVLKKYSLNLPEPAWLRLPYFNPHFDVGGDFEDKDEIEVPVRDTDSNTLTKKLMVIAKFDYPSFFTAEFMHNFAQGKLADALKQTAPYCHWLGGEAVANRIVAIASAHQLNLSRTSFVDSFYRVAAPGLSIATSHANVSATEITSIFTVLPIMFSGVAHAINSSSRPMGLNVQKEIILPLMRYFLTLQRLCRFMDNENSSPFFSEKDIQERFDILLAAEQVAFQSSLGRWLASQRLSIADIPVDVAHTIKGHTELHHRRQDMALRGNVQNDSAMMGEKSLGKDNRVQARTQRGSDKNPNLLAEQTAYQRHLRSGGVLERMFPVDAPEVENAGAENTFEGGSSGCLIESADVLATRKTMRPSKQVRLRKRDSTDAVVAVNELDGVSVEQFEILLGQRADGSEAGKSNRCLVHSLGVVSAVKIRARFPWLPTSLRRQHSQKVERMSGLEQTARASAEFYSAPLYDYALSIIDNVPSFVQLRLIFRVPQREYKDKTDELGGAAVLVRVLERCPDVRRLAENANCHALPIHATISLQSTGAEERRDAECAKEMRAWLAAGVQKAQATTSAADDENNKDSLLAELRWRKALEDALVEPVLMHEFGLDRLAFKLKNRQLSEPNQWGVLHFEDSEAIRKRRNPPLRGQTGPDSSQGRAQSAHETVRCASHGEGGESVELEGERTSNPASKLCHAVIGVADIIRVVYVHPDNSRPIEMLAGDASCEKLRSQRVASDQQRFDKEKKKQQADIEHARSKLSTVRSDLDTLRQHQANNSTDAEMKENEKSILKQGAKEERLVKKLAEYSAKVVAPVIRVEDVPSPATTQDLSECRFYHNINGRLTRPG